jgi:arylsulfatase
MPRPNILLFFTDQQRFDTIGALGNPVIKTPNLDRIANEGTAFTSAFSPCPVCVPARCSMHYGQYPFNSGCYENGYNMPEDGRQSFMDVLTGAGYRTHGIGKCHFTPEPYALRGFETREVQEEGGSPEHDNYLRFQCEHGLEHLCDPHGMRSEMYYIPQLAQMPAAQHPTQWVGDRSVAFIEGEATNDRPWFLFSSFIHPHPPFAPPAPWHKLYRAPMMPLPHVPADYEALWLFINRFQNRYKYRDQGIDQNLLRCMKQFYYACISFIDYQVGRVLQALEASGQLDNTLILFTSDHGELLGDYYCFGKRSAHDSCARIPLLARLPGCFEHGGRCDRPASLVDIMPTIMNAAGAQCETHELDGADLAQIVSGAVAREMVYAQFSQGGDAMYTAVSDEWKYVYSAPDDYEILIDRKQDRLDTRNHAGLSHCRAAHERMRSALIERLQAAGEEQAYDGDTWRRYPRKAMPKNPDAGLLVQDQRWADTFIPGYSEEGE